MTLSAPTPAEDIEAPEAVDHGEESDEYEFEGSWEQDERALEEGGYEDDEEEEAEDEEAQNSQGGGLTALLLGQSSADQEEEEEEEEGDDDNDGDYDDTGDQVTGIQDAVTDSQLTTITSIPPTPSGKKRTLDDVQTEETEGTKSDDEGAGGNPLTEEGGDIESGGKGTKKARV